MRRCGTVTTLLSSATLSAQTIESPRGKALGLVTDTAGASLPRRRVHTAVELPRAHADQLQRLREIARAALEAVLAGHRDLTKLALSLGTFDHAHLTCVFARHFDLPPRAVRILP